MTQHGLFGRQNWLFTRGEAVTAVDVSAKPVIDSAPCVLVEARSGRGIALATRIMADEEPRLGNLTRFLESWQLARAEVHAIFPTGPKRSAKVRQPWITSSTR